MYDETTATAPLAPGTRSSGDPAWALVVLWLADAQDRVGEVALLPEGESGSWAVLGRGPARDEDPGERVLPGMHRPGGPPAGSPLAARAISRVQLRMRGLGSERLAVENVGRCPLSVDGQAMSEAEVGVGSVLELRNQLLLLVTRRPGVLPEALVEHRFGGPDAQGMVGEGPIAWRLRSRIRFVAGRPAHVLITGPSGAGKELVARALHARSDRSGADLVARNAATLPESLVEAELFGTARDYPNRGMPERAGLVGEADGSTLFLDEIGELPEAQQARLLRVLDDGEYHRLGESRSRTADLRLVAATNRDPSDLKHDLLARLTLRLDVPGLDARREDVPLLARHLLRRIAQRDRASVARFFPGADPDRAPRLTPRLVRGLVQHPWSTHVRELEHLLWRAVGDSSGDWLDRPDGVQPEPPPSPVQPRDPDTVTADEIREALDRHEGVVTRAARDLGLSSRHVLYRLMKKHDLR